MNSIEILKEVIDGLENVIADVKGNNEVIWLAKEVKKDLADVVKAIQHEQGRIA